jgi:hypothetical protein
MTDSQHGGKQVSKIANLVGLCALAYTGRAVHFVASIRQPSVTQFVD